MSDQQEKERILQAAGEKFFSQGFSKVTVDEIASEIGMSKKTIYKFFPSKEDIMRAVAHFMMRRVERQVGNIVSSDKPFEQKLTEFLSVIGSIVGRTGRAQMMLDMKKHAPELWKEIESFRREQLLTKVQVMFQQAKQEGVFRPDLNTDIFMLMFVTCVEGIINPYTLSEQSFSAGEAFQSIFKVLFNGALTDDARAKLHLFEPTYSPNL
ncbi:MAG: TetR/AcrR family transcriptional regulator [Ignavibacteriae bacterium]|nr:TetR/AcrR family transcriptional regulator [Ignavibacteriota bacterium]